MGEVRAEFIRKAGFDAGIDVQQLLTHLPNDARATLLRLYEEGAPWRIGSAAEFDDHHHRQLFYDLGLLQAVFPEVRQGSSGRQFWLFNQFGCFVAHACRAKAQG